MKPLLIVAAAILAGSTAGVFGWDSARSISPIDDSPIHQISVDASRLHTDRFGKNGRASLVIQCEQNTTLIAIITPNLHMSDHGAWGKATFRVDSKAAQDVDILAANDAGSIALRSGSAIGLIRSMLNGSQLFVRVLPVNESSKDLYFPITGLEAAIAPIRESCGW